MATAQTVAVLGAGGTMGSPMARNLAGAGLTVRAWNRTRDKATHLREAGVEVADTPAEAVAGADVVLTMLADADAVLGAMDGEEGGLAGAAGELVWLQMSTIGESGTERCAALARERGVAFVDAPCSGRGSRPRTELSWCWRPGRRRSAAGCNPCSTPSEPARCGSATRGAGRCSSS